MALLTKVGTFNAATSTGNQAITGVGFQPKALIIWGVGTTTDGAWTTNWFTEGIGFSTSPTNQYAQAAEYFSGSADRRRIEACAFIQTNTGTSAIVRRADLVSMDSDGFTLDWTIAREDGDYKVLGYIALGGDDLTGAKVVNWQMPTSTGTKAVTGVGFQPDCVLHVHAGGVTALTDGGDAESSAALGLGAMTPDAQWASGIIASSSSNQARNQENNRCLTVITSGGNVTNQAQYESMDADGFTVNFGAVDGAFQVISLCLAGGQWDAGTITKATTTGTQSVTGSGFTPTGLLLAGVQDVAQATPVSETIYGLGAADGTNSFATALSAGNTENYTESGLVYVKNNTSTSQDIDAEATLDSFDADGYTLDWATNDSVLTRIAYLAWGSSAPTAHPTFRAFIIGD